MPPKVPPPGLIYIATKYPLLSETFIYEEILALIKLGYRVNFFVLYPTGNSSHGFINDLDENVYYLPPSYSFQVLIGHLYFIFSLPGHYFSVFYKILRETIQNPIVMMKSIYAFSKGVSLANILRKHPQDHIHSHWATMPTTVAYVASRLTGIQFSFTSHAWDIFKERAMLGVKLENSLFHTTISQYNKDYIQSLSPALADKIHVIRCGINVDQFIFRTPYQVKTPIEILFIGRLVEKKGVLKLIEACERLRSKGHDFICNIIGDGPQSKQASELINIYGLQNCVNMVGGLRREQLIRYWENASMFVLPCTIEENGNRDGIPVVLMEAMALGIPVISTTVSGIPELVEDGISGLLVSPQDIGALCDAILRIIEDVGLVQQLIDNARDKVVSEYNISVNAMKKAELIELHIKRRQENDI